MSTMYNQYIPLTLVAPPVDDEQPETQSLPWDNAVLFIPPHLNPNAPLAHSWVQELRGTLASLGFTTTAKTINASSSLWIFSCSSLATEHHNRFKDPNTGPEALMIHLIETSKVILASFEYQWQLGKNPIDPPPYATIHPEEPCALGANISGNMLLCSAQSAAPEGRKCTTVVTQKPENDEPRHLFLDRFTGPCAEHIKNGEIKHCFYTIWSTVKARWRLYYGF